MPSTGGDRLWIALGDIHGDIKRCGRIPELPRADGIIVTGDLTNVGGVREAEAVMNAIVALGLPCWAQIGNMDKPEVDGWLTKKGWNLHNTVRELAPDVAAFGIGASTPTPFKTPSEFPESSYAEWLDRCWQDAGKYPHTILVSHNPPKGTACDVVSGSVHVGSQAVRDFLEKAQPDLCLCGHIHEARAMDKVGRTIVLNPGAFGTGGYILVRLAQGKLDAELCTISQGASLLSGPVYDPEVSKAALWSMPEMDGKAGQGRP
ncbi:MAG: metallophosphoesterase [Desulfovibrio sp.]|jgi:Icc-related predicted phosphoesterase|nr:metallophosphoesterase [Desulfovibrio sp.]